MPLVGCGAAVPAAAPVDYVWTRTPGVVFVIVRPAPLTGKRYPVTPDQGSGQPVDPHAEYVLACDARSPEGMRCEVASEAALRRYSYTPNPVTSAPAMDQNVGELVDEAGHEKSEKSEAQGPGPAAPPGPQPVTPPTRPAGGKK